MPTDYKTDYASDKNVNTLNKGSFNDYGDGTPARQTLAKQAPGETYNVVVVAGSPDAMTNLLLTGDHTVDHGALIGTFIGTLVPEGGVGPYLFTIVDDPDDKFTVSENALITDNPIDYFAMDAHSVTAHVLDANNQTFEKSFVITVNQTPLPPFDNTKAVEFNGIDQHTEAAYDAGFSGLANFSASAWVYPNSLSGETTVLSQFGGNGDRAYRFNITAGGKLNIVMSESGTGQESFTGTEDVDLDVWTHIGFAFDGPSQTIQTWVNGVLDVDDVTVMTILKDTVGEPFRVGARGDSGFPEVAFYEGLIDEVSIYNTTLTTPRFQELYNLGVPANVAALSSAAGLISWWRMGDGDTYPTLLDGIGSNDMSMENMAPANIVNPDFSNTYSMNFNGVDERIDTPIDMSGKTEFTMAGWFYRDLVTQRVDITQSNNANSLRVKLLRNGNGFAYGIVDGGVRQFAENSVGWVHLTFVYDGNEALNDDRIKLYLNGAAMVPATSPVVATSVGVIDVNLRLGQDNGSGSYSDGNLDEVIIIDKALTPAEVTELYNGGMVWDLAQSSFVADVISWYRMGDELAAPTMPDQIGSNDATLVNMDDTNKDTEVP